MKIQQNKSVKKINKEKQDLFFYMLLGERGPYSEETGKKLYGEITSCWFHHILPKSKYPELRYCHENVILLTSDEHNSVENGKELKEVEKRKLYILEHYEDLKKETSEYIETILNPAYDHAIKNTTFFK